MYKGNGNVAVDNETVLTWMIENEPYLIKKVLAYFLNEDIEVSFDTDENSSRLRRVSDYIADNVSSIYQSLDKYEKLILYVMHNGYGWIVYENIDSTVNIISHIFKEDYQSLRKAVDSLLSKFLIYKFERLKRHNLLFSPPAIIKNLAQFIEEEEFGCKIEDICECEEIRETLSNYQYITLIAGFISYIITNSPRSSENNEIHKIDFVKMVDFFSDFADGERIEKVIKKLSRFGFFEKLNNRIIINKCILDRILELSINEQLFIVFLYDFMNKFDFKKSYFMTLKILANQKRCIPLRELFFYHLNNETYLFLKNETKNLKALLKQEEIKFAFFVKTLEAESIAVIKKEREGHISIGTDYIIMNEPHASLLNNKDFSGDFKQRHFIIETNFEVIVEPYLKPEILFKLALIAEPVTIQTISIFKITRESIYRSFAYGIKKNEILKFLKKHSKHEIPDNVINGIENYIDSLDINRLDNYKIIQLYSQDSSQVKENFKNKIIEIEPHTFLVYGEEILKAVEGFCKEKKISLKYIEDFLKGEDYSYKMHEAALLQNVRHLHTMKEFFDFYGSSVSGTGVKIDNEI